MRRRSKKYNASQKKTTDVSTLQRMLLNTILTSRSTYGGTTTFDGARDVSTALGYPKLNAITYADYYYKFRRHDVANRILSKPVEDSWSESPIIHAWDDPEDTFRYTWDDLEKKLHINSILARADLVSGIGRYGVLLLGFDDSANLNEPVVSASNLLYLQPYSEDNAAIKTFDTDQKSPRFGQPLFYGLRIENAPGTSSYVETLVHYSRIIHIADNLVESNIYGLPRLEKVFHRLLNLELIVGGSAEMFWQGAFPGLAFIMDEDIDPTSPTVAAFQTEIENYVHKMERYMKLSGMEVKNLAPTVSDPKSHADVQMTMISIASGIPKRILEGSERGELSSDQDAKVWDKKMDHRRTHFNEPTIIRPLIDKLGEVGVLQLPEDGYVVEWPDLSDPSDKDKSEIGLIRSEAIAKYTASPDTQLILSFKAFLEEIVELPPDKVERILEASRDIIPTEPDGSGDDETENL